MLARVANNLFWMGRYIERSEHIARYLNVNYFSSLDAPNELSQSRQFVLQSMLFMVGDPLKTSRKCLTKSRYCIRLDYSSFSLFDHQQCEICQGKCEQCPRPDFYRTL